MCRNIRQLHNFQPPATSDEVYAAALQYVRKVAAELLAWGGAGDGDALVELACMPQHRADPTAVIDLLPAFFAELSLDPPGDDAMAIEAAAAVVAARRLLDPPLAEHTCTIITRALQPWGERSPLLDACVDAGRSLAWPGYRIAADGWVWRLESRLRLTRPSPLPEPLVRALTVSCRTEDVATEPRHPPVDESAAATPWRILAQRPSLRRPARHPAFRAHFRSGVYTDYSSEFAPFGHDDGSDLLDHWSSHAKELGPHSTIGDVIAGSDVFDPVELPPAELPDAWAVMTAAITLLRFTGRIGATDHAAALRALDILIGEYGEQRELVRMRADLLTFPAES